ncbi:MAG: AtpZ/AtpI family protein [Marinilabiliaceae bacterium]|jgi:F0F1-type ATP synthase assembly protein I|nr:AtpZ/AtpI family protein [Marinilabiliaceae bacterium]
MSPKSKQKSPRQNQKKQKSDKDDSLNSFARYSGIAIQMVAIILIMTLAGVKLDARRDSETPVFTIVLSLLGVFAGIYTAIKDFIKK